MKKTMTGLTLRLEIEIKYDLRGTKPIALENLLREWPVRMAEEGMMTRDTEAEVDDWDSRVVWVGEVMSDPEEE